MPWDRGSGDEPSTEAEALLSGSPQTSSLPLHGKLTASHSTQLDLKVEVVGL